MGSETLGLVGPGFFDEFRGYSAPYLMVADFGALQHQCAGSHDGATADFGIVE